MPKISLLSVCLLLVLGLLPGCGSDDPAASGGAGGSAAAASYSQAITAAKGGTLTAPGATLVIPAGALAADTTVTLTVTDKGSEPDAANIAAKVFTFGPDGTQFLKPVAMTLAFDPSNPPADKTAKLAFLKDGAWVALADSKVTGTEVTATTTHFTPFTVVWTSGAGQTGGTCPAYTACGGDPTGTWSYTAGCATVGNADPFKGQCPGASFSLTIDLVGTVTFGGGNYTAKSTATTSSSVLAPKSCVGNDCAKALGSQFPNAKDDGVNCVGTSAPQTSSGDGTGTYVVAGNKMTLTDSKAGATPTDAEFCVKGNELSVHVLPKQAGGSEVTYTATKQ